MDKKVLLFDIDRTIFDTDKLLELQYESFAKIINTPDIEDFHKFWDNTLSGERHITSEERLNLICSEFKIQDFDLLSNVYYGNEYKYIYEESVFPQTKIVLNKLTEKFRLGIFSEGTEKYQNHKFKSLNLHDYFDKDLVFIFDAKDTQEALVKIPHGAIIVDDKERICQFLTENKIRAIWLNKNDDRNSSNFKTIHSLLELPGILL
ncbi:MAG TPA: HAD family hydrolase [Alphaproteobacteria bacterium]|jgi:FMN phosphatase YigB (HAD superfamily)|nr:HAD family hydrolase [Alphaproteobacteria bacterium]